MNTAVYENPITQRNIRTLSEFGVKMIEPREALLACGDLGKGALADTEDIISAVQKALCKGFEKRQSKSRQKMAKEKQKKTASDKRVI